MTDINASRYAVWRLSLVLDKFGGEFGDMVRALLARADAAETELCAAKAEVERLRQALEFYADPCDASEGSPCGYEGNMCCATARDALQENSHD